MCKAYEKAAVAFLLKECQKSSVCHFKENDAFLTKPAKNIDVLKLTFPQVFYFFTFISGFYG